MTVKQRNVATIVAIAATIIIVTTTRAQQPSRTDSAAEQSAAEQSTAERLDVGAHADSLGRSEQGATPAKSQQDSRRRTERVQPRLLMAPFQTPRELLRLLDIGPSELDSFVDGQPISASDEEAFMKVLFRMPQIGLDDIARWSQHPVAWKSLQTDPGPQRGEFFLFKGRVHTILKKSVRSKLAALFSFGNYYEVHIKTDSTTEVIAYTRTIPQAWHGRQHLDQRCRVSGMFLKLGTAVDGQPRFMFATRRIGWLPDRPSAELGIGPSQVLLGNLGMDVGLFDAVRARDGKPINAGERACFYALLRAAGRASADDLARHANPMQLATVLQPPAQLHGEVLRLRGSVRRITRVVVNEHDIQQRYGIDHYYQLDVLVPLGDAEIQITGGAKGKSGPVYRTNFPFTCCALAIPDAWRALVGKEEANVPAVLDGFFFKLWAYSNPYVASFDPRQRQLSPMLMLHEPIPARLAGTRNRSLDLAMGVGFIAVLAGIWGIIWWLGRTDRKHASVLVRKRLEPSVQVDFGHLEDTDE